MIKFQSIKNDPDLLPKLLNLVMSLVALGFVVISFIGPWFALPRYDVTSGDFYTLDSKFTLYFKLGLMLISVVVISRLLWVRKRGGDWKKPVIKGAILGFVCVLWYPSVIAHRDTELIGDAAWLQQQHDTMTWLGGDVFRAHSERSVELGTGVNAQDPPDRLAVYRPPAGSMGVTQINDWLWWFGYGPSFTQFVGSGWFYALTGYVLLGLCVCGFSWRESVLEARFLFKESIVFLMKTSVVMIVVMVAFVQLAHHALLEAKDSLADSDYLAARAKIERAIGYLPSLCCDTGIIRQLGYCDLKSGERASVNSQLYQVYLLERQGYFERARSVVDSLAADSTTLPRYQAREISRQQLRVAINSINSGRYSRAKSYLDRVLSSEDNCLQAYFHRQLVSLQTGDLVMNQSMHRGLMQLYQGVRSKNKRGVKAASDWMLAQGELKEGHVEKAWEARKRSMGK